MQKVFLSHSSKDKESYVRIVAQKLIKQIGEENVILDEITFQEGRRTIEEIEKNLQETDLFVIFISNSSLESDWVKQELFRAKELWDQKRLEQICPIVISENITFADTRIPKWLSDEYNLHYISRPNKAAQIIEQRIIELTFQRHPKLEERQKIFVGRNDLIALFEERMDNFEKEKPICIIASGIKSIGRKSLMRQCIYKGNVKSGSYPFPEFSMNYDESIEDFILKVYDLGFEEEMDLSGLFTKTMSEKVDIAAKLVSTMQKASDIIFIEDGGSIISQDGICAEWFTKVLEHYSVVKKFSVCIAAKYRLHAFPENTSFATKDKIYTIDVAELNKKERDGLLSRYLQFENMELELDDMRLISGLLSGYPEQVFYSVSIIKEKGIDYLRRNTNEIVEFNSKKASILLKEYEGNQEKLSVLAMLSLFDYVSLNMIRSIVDDNAHYMGFVDEFLSNSICEYVGALKEYIRVNETIKDYVMRNNYCILEEHKKNMDKLLRSFLESSSMNEYDVPEYLFFLKEALIKGKKIDERFLVPSLYLKTMTELYNKRKNKEVVDFAYKALENEAYIDSRIAFEIRYLLCSALAKLKDRRFNEEVRKIKDANYYFLYGFYYRQIGKFIMALEMLNKSMEERSNFSKAKREVVQVYIGMQDFQKAKALAEENYKNYQDNPYHIQAYFSCLIKSEKNKENKEILQNLISDLKGINTDVAKEMALRCQAQIEAFYNDNQELSISLIDDAIAMNPNIQYARLVKFDICERFNMIEEMKNILSFFEQGDYKNKYQNNIVCFRAILYAKQDSLEKAEGFFRTNIKEFTDEAKDKFVARLERICEERTNK